MSIPDDLRPPRQTPRLALPVPGDVAPADYVTDTGALADRLDVVAGIAGVGAVAVVVVPPEGWSAAGEYKQVAMVAVTIANPAGARVRITGGVSAFTGETPSRLDQYITIDGGAYVSTGMRYHFNETGVHVWAGSWEYVTPAALPRGAHTIRSFFQASVGSLQTDDSNRAALAAYELP